MAEKSSLAMYHAAIEGVLLSPPAGAGTAVVVPMDGFHYTKAQLAAFPDPSAAFARRGAHWTFDAAAFVACVRCIRQSGASAVPSFDHAIGDPVEGDIRVEPGNKVVLVEGKRSWPVAVSRAFSGCNSCS